VDARALSENLLREGAADCRRLHEPVAREAARRVDAVRDLAEDRMRVGGHVVEPCPGAVDRRLARGRVAVMETSEAVVEQRLVDALLEAPTRFGVNHRE